MPVHSGYRYTKRAWAETVKCWRINYGLEDRRPQDAAKWWSDALQGKAPAGAVAALGIALERIEQLEKQRKPARRKRAR